MTREEASKTLTQYIDYDAETPDYYEMEKACKVALKALKQAPCEDCISRDAVIDYIDKMPSELTADGRRMIRRRTLEEYISDTLPSVTPKQKMGRWIREKKHHKDDFQEFDYWDVRCSECGARKRIGWTNIRHCPMCGARMEESEEIE